MINIVNEIKKIETRHYDRFYRKVSAPFRRKPWMKTLLKVLNWGLTAWVYVTYPMLLLVLFLKKDRRVWKVSLIPAAAFSLITILRKRINRRRPYEDWDLDPLIRKDTKGKSLPSRHVFSCAVISVAFAVINPLLGLFYFTGGILLCILRVIGGVHYPLDVAAGFAAGILSGLPMLLGKDR
ncbi:MAG: phosphatase PAP2 family protein [Lachnospiraceae bacterium]